MSVISKTSRPSTPAAGTPRTPKEHDGIWLNLGLITDATEENPDGKFVRLPRGVALSDLDVRPVYPTMDPDFATELTLMNQVITQLKDKGLTLAEGESVSIGLEVQLYRRQEEQEAVVPSKDEAAAVANVLFG